MAYSMDLRLRVLADCDAGLGTLAVARRYHVSPAWVRRLKQHRRQRGDIVPRTGTGRRPVIDDRKLARLVEAQPDATLVELRDRLGLAVTPQAVSKALRRLGLTFKKKRSTPPSRTARMSPPAAPPGG